MSTDTTADILYWVRFFLDFTIIAYLIYKILIFSRGTKGANILKGVLVLLLVWLISGWLGLAALRFVFGQIILYGLLGLMVIFQPELRMGLEKLGKKNLVGFTMSKSNEENNKLPSNLIDGIVKACVYMSKRRIGALICIEMEDSLAEYIKTGISIDSKISEQILENIFTPNVPLHDGALIIKDKRINAASCYLPLSKSTEISKELGTRHRASVGLSEVTDAVVIVVSEESGGISLVRNGKLYRDIGEDSLRSNLEMIILAPDDSIKEDSDVLNSNNTIQGFWKNILNFFVSGPESGKSKIVENTEQKEERKKDEEIR